MLQHPDLFSGACLNYADLILVKSLVSLFAKIKYLIRKKSEFSQFFRTEVKLESLEDAVVLEDFADDLLSDKHGCPAYVSPEILRSNTQYSGRAADMWGLGVMLYTMLVGR